MALHWHKHNSWRYISVVVLLMNSSINSRLLNASEKKPQEEAGFWQSVKEVSVQLARATGKAIEQGLNMLTEDETQGITRLLDDAVIRYNYNITQLQQSITQIGSFAGAELKALSPNPSYAKEYYNDTDTQKPSTEDKDIDITLEDALSENNLFLSSQLKTYFSKTDKNTPFFKKGLIKIASSTNSEYATILIKNFREKIAQIEKAILHKAINDSGKVSRGEIIKSLTEQAMHVKGTKDAALITAATAADQSEKNLKTILSFMHNPKTAATLLATFGGGVAMYHLIPRLIAKKPQIVSEMSFLSPYERLMNKKLPPSNFEQIVFTAETGPQVMRAVTHMRRVIRSGGELMNLIFFGPPGTGKTMSAKAIARSVGADYMLINASAFEQLTPGQAVSELEATFRLAKNNKKPVIIFFDEADAIMGRRGSGMETQTSRRVINTFLANVTDTHNNKIMFILATNIPGSLDPAVLSRFPEEGWIFFDRPSQSERARILRMNLENFCAKDNITLGESAKENMENYATILKGSTGRDLRAIARSITDGMVDEGGTEITDHIIREKLTEIERNKKNMAAYQYAGGNNPATVAG